jgi:hypothetical protein
MNIDKALAKLMEKKMSPEEKKKAEKLDDEITWLSGQEDEGTYEQYAIVSLADDESKFFCYTRMPEDDMGGPFKSVDAAKKWIDKHGV